MEARWRERVDGSFRATISIIAQDSAGLANSITEVISRDLKLNMRSISFVSRGDGSVIGTVSVEVAGAGIVDMLVHSLMRIKGVQRAYRAK